jgi:predicted GNAT superfamily acetyltransferase
MLGVLPDHREQGVASRLKWSQREAALARGVEVVTWAFDPLQAPGADLSLGRLGAVADEFVEDMYGNAGPASASRMPTDRLLARWELKAPRVTELLTRGEHPRGGPPPQLPRINEVEWSAGWPVSSDPNLDLAEPRLLLEIPPDWDTLCQAAPRMAQDWQAKARAALQGYLGRGYVASGFAASEEEGRRRPLYVLEKPA